MYANESETASESPSPFASADVDVSICKVSPADLKRKRDAIEYALCRDARKAGRQLSDAEKAEIIQASLKAWLVGLAKDAPKPVQGSLFEADDATRQTRQESAVATKSTAESRRESIERFVALRGDHGATRDEIAVGLSLLVQSVCDPVLELRRAGRLVSTRLRRKTRSGFNAVVMVAPRSVRAKYQSK